MEVIRFTRHVFATLTYPADTSWRNDTEPDWTQVSKDFNHWITNLRRGERLRGAYVRPPFPVEYLRVVEEHKSGLPHIHCILQFPDARLRVNIANGRRYFERSFYKLLKDSWKYNDDYQPPINTTRSTLGYILKYMRKNSTSKTVWKKVLAVGAETKSTTLKEVSVLVDKPTVPPMKMDPEIVVTNPIYKHNIKLLSWSRSFDFSVFFMPKPKNVLKY